MEVYIGTSGWSYAWNPKKNLNWYLENTPFNAVEVNSSFYRFPSENTIKGWGKFKDQLRFVIKVNRSITHLHKFNNLARDSWTKFFYSFEALDSYVDFYLFQIPPSMSIEYLENIIAFANFTRLGTRFALEPRRVDWFNEEIYKKLRETSITLVSVSAPNLPENIILTTPYAYIRFHGKTEWYAYNYSKEELYNFAQKIKNLSVQKVFIFFNNDAMLSNGITMYNILKH
ncbi:MAG TPA: DUF72 domain-containing protein [Dictyoglomaceae bacterium]|nr:DUF72 domain-containing protein [Dictyoglomaceae bacterium]HOL38737.1 DUF72 domain-containing protein [Dictyoglomaceae bacterium]HPP15514.1 DUF72 domain-containing protein [Dictyoglomaceae bacterium]HPU43077.1 DUF72 domain-containing protein [Dictyoglomaceae bacterium]